MRIALVSEVRRTDRGLVGRHVSTLAAALEDSGAEVELVHGRGRQIARYLQSAGYRFDLVHVHGTALLPAVRAARLAREQVLLTPHYYAAAPRELRALSQGRCPRHDRGIAELAATVVCVSRSEAVLLDRLAPSARVELIPTGVDVDAIGAAHPLPIDGRPIVTIDRLTSWTGVHRLISALPALSRAYGLVVIGAGHGRNSLEAHADYLRVADRVRFLGAIDDAEAYRWLRTAAVLATLKEESLWGGNLLAAACAGTPVVASDIPANREAATLAELTDVRFVSRRASPFVVADAIREQASAGSHRRPELVPTWGELAEQMLGLYDELAPSLVAAK